MYNPGDKSIWFANRGDDEGAAVVSTRKSRQRTADGVQRRNRIVEIVAKAGAASVEELADTFGVSPVTVYRDLTELVGAGMIIRSRGVVTAAGSGLQEAPAKFRLGQHVVEKSEIAAHAATLVPRGSAVLLDDSTTGVLAVRHLKERTPVTVVTNSLLVAREVEEAAGVRLFVLGGEYHQWADALLGRSTTQAIAAVAADVCLISVSGVIDGVAYHPYEEVAEVKQAMMRAAARSVALVDHTKFERRALHHVASLRDFDVVVVDRATPSEIVEHLREEGVRVDVAPSLHGASMQ